jgi:hypothetical protein
MLGGGIVRLERRNILKAIQSHFKKAMCTFNDGVMRWEYGGIYFEHDLWSKHTEISIECISMAAYEEIMKHVEGRI